MNKIAPREWLGDGVEFKKKISISPLRRLEGNLVYINYSIPYEVYGDTNDSEVVRYEWGCWWKSKFLKPRLVGYH